MYIYIVVDLTLVLGGGFASSSSSSSPSAHFNHFVGLVKDCNVRVNMVSAQHGQRSTLSALQAHTLIHTLLTYANFTTHFTTHFATMIYTLPLMWESALSALEVRPDFANPLGTKARTGSLPLVCSLEIECVPFLVVECVPWAATEFVPCVAVEIECVPTSE